MSRRGLGGMSAKDARRRAQDAFWSAKRTVYEAKHIGCPRRGDLASKARSEALRSAGLFAKVGDQRSMGMADSVAAEARHVLQSCPGYVPLSGARPRRKKRARC
jgi:hypothetical protein